MKVKYVIWLAISVMVSPAQAYIGPGAGLGAIGTAVAFVAAILLLIVGFVWYPLKRLLRGSRKPPEISENSGEEGRPD